MHEMSVAMSLFDLARTEAESRGCKRLRSLRVEYGALAGIMPEALELGFEIITRGTPHEGARLELVEIPLRLRCPLCGHVFGGQGRDDLWNPCPVCGEAFGHIVEQGRELRLTHIDASGE